MGACDVITGTYSGYAYLTCFFADLRLDTRDVLDLDDRCLDLLEELYKEHWIAVG